MNGLRALVNSKDWSRNNSAARADSSAKLKRTPKYYHRNTIKRPVLEDRSESSSNMPTKPAVTFGELIRIDKTFGKLEKMILKQEDQPTASFLDSFQPVSPSDNFEIKECIIGEAFILSSGYESVEYLPTAQRTQHWPDSSYSHKKTQPSTRTWTFKKKDAAKPQIQEFTFHEGNSSFSQAEIPLTTVKKNQKFLPDFPFTDFQATEKKNKENIYHIDLPPVQTTQMTRRLPQPKPQTVSNKSSGRAGLQKNYEFDVLKHDSSDSLREESLIDSIKFRPIITVLKEQQILTRHPKPAEKPIFDVKPIKPAGIQVEMIKLSIESPSDSAPNFGADSPAAFEHPLQSFNKPSTSRAQVVPLKFEPVDIRGPGVLAEEKPAPAAPQQAPQPPAGPAPQPPLEQQEAGEESDEDLTAGLHQSALAKNGSIRFKSHFRSASFHSSLRRSSVSPPRYGSDDVGPKRGRQTRAARLVFSAKFLTYVSSRIYSRVQASARPAALVVGDLAEHVLLDFVDCLAQDLQLDVVVDLLVLYRLEHRRNAVRRVVAPQVAFRGVPRVVLQLLLALLLLFLLPVLVFRVLRLLLQDLFLHALPVLRALLARVGVLHADVEVVPRVVLVRSRVVVRLRHLEDQTLNLKAEVPPFLVSRAPTRWTSRVLGLP